MTLKEFLLESELFRYSKEKYELDKTCSELAVMEQYIESQEFFMKNMKYTDGTIALSESTAFPLITSEVLDSLKEQYFVKLESVGRSIKKGFLAVINGIKSFFMKLVGKWDPLTKRGQAVLKELQKRTLTDADTKSIGEILSGVVSESKINLFDNQKFRAKVTLPGDTDGKIGNQLAAALSDSVIIVEVALDGSREGISKEDVLAMDGRTLLKALEILDDGFSESNVAAAWRKVSSAWAESKRKGLEVSVDTRIIKDVADKLQKVIDELKLKEGEIAQKVTRDATLISAATGGSDTSTGRTIQAGTAAATAGITEFFSKLKGAIAPTMSVYNSIGTFRSQSISKLESFVKTGAKSDEKKDEKKSEGETPAPAASTETPSAPGKGPDTDATTTPSAS